jgi:hypothetical protein
MSPAATGTIVRGVLLAAVCGAALVSAQPPGGVIIDPDVKPAQRLQQPVPPTSVADTARNPSGTTVPTGVTATPGRGQAAVVDPAPPMLQLAVRTPSHVPVGKPVPYRITVTNSSAAKALRVKVKMPWPDGAAALTKCEPKQESGGDGKEQVWDVGDMQRGESKAIELTFTPKPDAKQVTGTAYVNFEYGAKVETAIDTPKLEVKKTASPEVAVGDLVTVRVTVANPTPVAIPNVKLTEGVPAADAEFRGDDKAERLDKQDGVRVWDLGTLAAGQSKTLQYQLLTRKAGELVTYSTAVSPDVSAAAVRADSRTKVLQPGLSLVFTGSPATTPKAPAVYKAVVRNTGTLPLGNVTLAVDVPAELSVTKRTNGAKSDRGRLTWVIPKLPAGEGQEFNIQCEPEQGVAGKKLLKATATDGRGLVEKQTAEVGTEFVGKADLTWKPTFDKAWVQVGRQGTLTVVVKNQGAETDSGVRLRVKLPPEVKYLGNSGTIPATFENAEVLFPAQKLAPGKTAEFVVTYEGKSAGPGRFVLMLEGESLGGKPLTKEQEVLVER